MTDIREVYGIGNKKANELNKYYNIRTIYSLRNYVKKIPDIITEAQRSGLRYHKHINKCISYKDAKKHVNYIQKRVPGAIIAGSFRRKEKKICDIDVLITGDIKKAIKKLDKYIVASLAIGEDKFNGIAKIPGTTNYRRIDIIKTTREEKPFSLLYFTGDVTYNIYMRQVARKMGLSLSQKGLKKTSTGRMVKNIKNEKDIFKYLKIPYKEPEDRVHKKTNKKKLNIE